MRVLQELCDPSLTCFEPESCGHLVEGLHFHQFFFNAAPGAQQAASPNTLYTMSCPNVRLLAGGQSAIVAYTRIVQHVGSDGRPVVSRMQVIDIRWFNLNVCGHGRPIGFLTITRRKHESGSATSRAGGPTCIFTRLSAAAHGPTRWRA
jgi:hypothetical protein